LFLAAKTEENHIQLEHYLHRVKEYTQQTVDKKRIQKLELVLLQGLQFQLIVYHPYRSLYAFVHDFFDADRQHETHKLYENAKKFLKDSYKTDISFFYPPGTIALAALYHFNPTDTEHFIEKSYANKDIEHLITAIKKIDTTVTEIASAQQLQTEKLVLRSAVTKMKAIQNILKEHKIFDVDEMEKKQQAEDEARRSKKLQERSEKEMREISELLSA
jgi:cyclin H